MEIYTTSVNAEPSQPTFQPLAVQDLILLVLTIDGQIVVEQ